MPNAKINKTNSVAGISFKVAHTVTDEGVSGQEVSTVKAQAGSLTTRSDTTSGEITLSTGHGVLTGDIVDLYWTGGSRRGVTVGTVATNVVPVSLGSGDNLPSQGADISVSVVTEASEQFFAEELKFIIGLQDGAGQLVFLDESDTEILAITLSANLDWNWLEGNGYDNPLSNESSSTTDVAKFRVSTSDATAAKTFKFGLLRNSI